MRALLDGFKSTLDGGSVQSRYSLVLLTRYDVLWKQPITGWAADLNRLNFLSRCEPTSSALWGEACVHDILHVMPSHLFAAFDAIVGDYGCFNLGADNTTYGGDFGHGCLDAWRKRHFSART